MISESNHEPMIEFSLPSIRLRVLLAEYLLLRFEGKSGLYIRDDAVERPHEGIVLAAGTAAVYAVAARILFGKHTGSETKPNGETLLILEEKDVLGELREVEV